MPIRTVAMLLPTLIVLAVILVIPALIGVYVYRDARRRGMNAVLWTLVAVIAPALVGFIIYLLVRGGYSDLECPQCGTRVTEQYVVCPQCGAKLRQVCANCSAPVERDWKVCPHCAAPLDGVQGEIVQPRRRQDKGLGKILVAIIVTPVVLIVLAVISFSAVRSAPGSCSLQEVTFDEYLHLQQSGPVREAVQDWLDEVTSPGQRGDRAYILQYEHHSEFTVENHYYLLVYVPMAGYQDGMAFGMGSSLFNPTFELRLERTRGESSLFCVEVKSARSPMPKITLDGKAISSVVRTVDYNPTLFYIAPDYTQVEPGDDVFLPERLSVVKIVDNANVGVEVVEDEDMMLKLLAAIDGGERLPTGQEPVDYDFRDGFEIIVEYKIQGDLIMHPDMARHLVFMENGMCYLNDDRVRTSIGGSPFRRMDGDFYGLLEGLFEEG